MKPRKGESMGDFHTRGMSDKGMMDDYPNKGQRSAALSSTWRKNNYQVSATKALLDINRKEFKPEETYFESGVSGSILTVR